MTGTLLVTGASTGLGAAVAALAAQKGFRTFAALRSPAAREKLDALLDAAGVAVEVVKLDVEDAESVTAAIDHVIRTAGTLDVLVNNAGVGFARNIEQTSEAEIARVMDVNFMGVLRTTRAVLPHMRARRSGRIINITSVGGLVGQPFNEVYCASKFAVEGFTESLASYVTPRFGVQFSLVEPGGIRSEFAARAMQQIAESGGFLEDDYLPVLQAYIAGAQGRSDDEGLYQSPEEMAEVVLQCATAETPPLRIRTSDWAENLCRLKTEADPDGTRLATQVTDYFLGPVA
jgi:NAD(P)-dependent dehydrogenase (short-subunit alcohol dehydrogenase family)